MKNSFKKSITTLLISTFGLAAYAADEEVSPSDLSFSAGVKLWNSQWQASYGPYPYNSNTKPVAIYTIAGRYKDFSLSLSSLAKTTYDLSIDYQNNTTIFPSDRSEWDVNFSYFLHPNLSASIGYKNLKFFQNTKINGPVIGLSGFAPMNDNFGIYGSLGIGWLETKTISQKYNTNYELGEVGLAYSFDKKPSFVKGLTATVGYRFQKLTANKTHETSNGGKHDSRDTTSGLTIGLIGSF